MISISLCMIIKNEEKVLARCLDSLTGLFEEIIIVDTGSTDSSKKIASMYTDKIYDFEWVDDFSKARNYAFSKATMDYIYSADADEVLDEINRTRFLNLKSHLLPEIEIVQMLYITDPEYSTTESVLREYRPKLYKRLRTFTWLDPIHESVNLNPVVYDSDIEILHKPVSLHSPRDFKSFCKITQSPSLLSPKLHKMYATELMVSGDSEDFKNAYNYFLSALSYENILPESISECYCVLAKYYRIIGDVPNFFKWCLKSVISSPCSEICLEIGLFYLEKKDFNEAVVWLINACDETKPILDGFSSTTKAFSALADCYESLAAENETMSDTYSEMANEYRKKSIG